MRTRCGGGLGHGDGDGDGDGIASFVFVSICRRVVGLVPDDAKCMLDTLFSKAWKS